MEKVNKGIIFSNDIYRILKGQNALDFSYEQNGLVIPSEKQIEKLKEDFKKDTNRIFDNEVTIFSEEEVERVLYSSLEDCYGYPHRVIR